MSVRMDLESMFKEIEMIHKKYGIPKGMGFVPDKLEIIIERKGLDNFKLTYSEFFNYLPNYALNTVKEITLQLLQQIGVPAEKIIQIENGVKTQMSGDFRITIGPIIEILLQNKNIKNEIRPVFESINKTYQLFAHLFDFHWEWNDKIQSKFDNYITAMQEHPAISSEIEAVIKKYKK